MRVLSLLPRGFLPLLVGASQAGCSVFSPVPLWELAKATGSLASSALSVAPSSASRTVYHPHPAFDHLCIEFNRDSQAADLVPALQAELRRNTIESRVYEAGTTLDSCEVWLRYTASIEWGVPPLSDIYKPYLDAASLSLHTREGRLLAASNYALDGLFGMGRWSDTRSKLAPVVTALLTGVEHPVPDRPAGAPF